MRKDKKTTTVSILFSHHCLFKLCGKNWLIWCRCKKSYCTCDQPRDHIMFQTRSWEHSHCSKFGTAQTRDDNMCSFPSYKKHTILAEVAKIMSSHRAHFARRKCSHADLLHAMGLSPPTAKWLYFSHSETLARCPWHPRF